MGPPKVSVEIEDFSGLVTNLDPRDAKEGAALEQVNAACIRQGVLTVRAGYKAVTFDS